MEALIEEKGIRDKIADLVMSQKRKKTYYVSRGDTIYN